MASFNGSDHDLTATTTTTASNTTTDNDNDKKLTIIYGTLGTVLALLSLMVATISFMRPGRQWRRTDHRDGACEDDESRFLVVAQDDCELQSHSAVISGESIEQVPIFEF
jgi:hypothetical protein